MKTEHLSEIRTKIAGAEGEHADHLTTYLTLSCLIFAWQSTWLNYFLKHWDKPSNEWFGG